MKKFLPVLLLIVLLVSSCNFPEEQDLSEDPVVQTRVAVLLTQGAPAGDEPFNIVEPINKDIEPTEAEDLTPTEDAKTDTPEETPQKLPRQRKKSLNLRLKKLRSRPRPPPGRDRSGQALVWHT